MAADTWESLMAKVNKRLEKQMSGPVTKRVEKELNRTSQEATGEHSRSSGGLGDPSNIISNVSNNGTEIELVVRNTARPQESVFGTPISGDDNLFSSWVNDGLWMDLNEYITTGQKVKRLARPFVDEAQESVNGPLKSAILSDLQKGFK